LNYPERLSLLAPAFARFLAATGVRFLPFCFLFFLFLAPLALRRLGFVFFLPFFLLFFFFLAPPFLFFFAFGRFLAEESAFHWLFILK